MKTFCSFVHIAGTAMLLITLATASLRAEESAETLLLKGTVVDENGTPVADADIFFGNVFAGDFLNPEWWRCSDEHGRFALPIPADQLNNWTRIYAVSPEKERLAQERPKLKEGVPEIPELTLTLKKARIITGTVTDETGAPVEGAIVCGHWELPYPSVTLTDKDGNFRFPYPEDGIMTLHQVCAVHKELGMDYVETKEGSGLRSDSPPDSINDGPFELKLTKWKTFKIRVVDEHQTPLPGIKVYSWLPRKSDTNDSLNPGSLLHKVFRSVTDAQGSVDVPSFTERTNFFSLCPDAGIVMPNGDRRFFGYAYKRWVDFDKSEEIPTLVMERLVNVKGTVKRADGTPVAWSRITIKKHYDCGHGIRWTNAKGEFNHDRGKPGELFDIGVESTLGAAPGVFAFDVGDGVEEKRLDFVLEKGIRLHGTVYLPDGTPAEQYQIMLSEKCPPDILELIQSALGTNVDSETCPPGGCPEGVVIRQVSDYGKPDSGGKYEYFLPAVQRKYDISVSSYTNNDVELQIEDYEVKGDEGEITLDFRMKVREKEEP